MTEVRTAEPLGLLLLEDNPADSRLLVESLRDAVAAGQVVVQTVRRLADALRELKRMQFSCVLVDLGLPDGEGVAHVRRIREADPAVAIIVLTGLGDRHVADEAFRLGAQDYLLKGEYWGDDLLRAIRKAMAALAAPSPDDAAAPAAAEIVEPLVDVARGRFVGVRLRPADATPEAWRSAFSALMAAGEPDVRQFPMLLPAPPDAECAAMLRRDHDRATWLLVEPGMLDDAARMQRLAAARDAGASLWLDCWRPGSADLDLLSRAPLDGIVLDPTLGAAAGRDEERAQRFVRATLAAAGSLPLGVLAEGVTLAEQQACLAAMGCRWMQGPWFCEPGPASDLQQRWRKGPRGFERRAREAT